MAFENLPGVFPKLIDGNLKIAATSQNPVVLVLGTSPSGDTETFYRVDSVSTASRAFGRNDGTLVRGLYEVVAGGAENIRLMRIGAKSAKLTNVGGGITIETVEKDDNAGLNYKIYWQDSADRLKVYRASDDELVYDNNPGYPAEAVDLNEVSVTGTVSGNPGNIGTASAPVTLSAANGVSGAVYTAGNDGIRLSRMELYEALYNAYSLLESQDIDIVLPMNVYLDDDNVTDLTTAEVSTLNTSAPWATSSTYPEPGSSFDALGELYVQEYQGKNYFWWDMDRDGVAEVYPSIGSSTSTKNADGVTISGGDWHDVNFGYQLADFCYRQSEDNAEMIGVIGVKPPVSWSLTDVSNWIGKEPTLTEDSSENSVVDVNGTGLLGNKWLAGRKGKSSTGLPGHIVNGVDGLAEGGFIATDTGWIDDDQQTDRNDRPIDIGKYLSVVGAQAILANPTAPTAYAACGAGVYAGFVSSLPGNSAPTNKVVPGVRLPFRVSTAKLDVLAGHRLVMFQNKSKGIVVADAPTAARPDSDYKRLTTIRIVTATIDAIRAVADPFLGEAITGARLAALETAIEQALVKLQKAQYLQRFQHAVSSTPSEQIQGKATVELVLVPAFELRQITVNVALSAQ